MTRRLLMAAIACMAAGMMPVQAAGKTVALMPAVVMKGAGGNGGAVTEALRASLEREGFTVLPVARVQDAMSAEKMDMRKPHAVPALSRLREATGADYVVYPRVLSVGQGINTDEYQANILLNVVGTSKKAFFHTRQIGQVFQSRGSSSDRAVITRGAAGEVAGKLLEGFFTKAK